MKLLKMARVTALALVLSGFVAAWLTDKSSDDAAEPQPGGKEALDLKEHCHALAKPHGDDAIAVCHSPKLDTCLAKIVSIPNSRDPKPYTEEFAVVDLVSGSTLASYCAWGANFNRCVPFERDEKKATEYVSKAQAEMERLMKTCAE